MRKIVIALLVALATAVPFTAFASGAPEATASSAKTELRLAWWGNPTRDERTLKVIDLYQQKFPNVVIDPETVGWGGYWDRVNTQVAAGNLPDVMQHDYAYMLQWVSRNQLTDLTPLIQKKTIDLTGVDDSYISGGRVAGKVYGVSLGTNAICFVYDPAVLAKAGIPEPRADWTWADFERISIEVFRKTGVQTTPLFTTDPKVGFDNWIRQTGRPFYSPDGKTLGFTDPTELRAYFDVQLRLKAAGALVSPESAFINKTPQEGEFAMGVSWVTYLWSNQVVAEAAAAKRPIKIALPPRIAGSRRPGTFLKPSMFFAIPATSKNVDAAAKFVNFFLTDIEANKILLGERGVPIIPSVREAVKASVNPVMGQVFDYISLVGNGNSSPIDPPDPAASGEVLKFFRDTTQAVLLGAMSSSEGADRIIRQSNAILAK